MKAPLDNKTEPDPVIAALLRAAFPGWIIEAYKRKTTTNYPHDWDRDHTCRSPFGFWGVAVREDHAKNCRVLLYYRDETTDRTTKLTHQDVHVMHIESSLPHFKDIMVGAALAAPKPKPKPPTSNHVTRVLDALNGNPHVRDAVVAQMIATGDHKVAGPYEHGTRKQVGGDMVVARVGPKPGNMGGMIEWMVGLPGIPIDWKDLENTAYAWGHLVIPPHDPQGEAERGETRTVTRISNQATELADEALIEAGWVLL